MDVISRLLPLTLILLTQTASAGNVLVMMDLPSYSNQIFNYAIAEALIERGHNITMAVPVNYTQIGRRDKKSNVIVFEGMPLRLDSTQSSPKEERSKQINTLQLIKLIADYVLTICHSVYKSNGFKMLLNYPHNFKFDLIIIDMTLTPCLYPFIQRFNFPPTVGTTSLLLPPFLSRVFGNDMQPSYLPFYNLKYTDNMDFFQRVNNFVSTKLESILKLTYERYQLEALVKETFGKHVVSFDALERHISLLLCNINMAFHLPQPLTPNIIPVGGLHIKPIKPLPQDLQKIVDNAREGVILFSLGTNVRSGSLSTQNVEALTRAFGQLKQTVIWKYEGRIENVPKNVIIRRFLPQYDILGHPNVRLMIGHGGALSSLEAAHLGIPVIGIPLYLDQHITVELLVERKLGLKLDIFNLTSEKVLWSINEVLTNPIYSENMKSISRRMRDQLNSPLETAVFWTEYAMRNNGTHFLNPKSRDMHVFVTSCADVVCFLVIVTLLITCLFILILQKIISLIKASTSGPKKNCKSD